MTSPSPSSPPRGPRGPLRIALLAALAWMAATSGCGLRTGDRPHVVLVIIDKLRADQLTSYGHEGDPSPELAALAERGVRFENVLAQCTWTRPSIGSMLTSRYPRTIGIYDEARGILPHRFDTLAETLRRAGYRTIGATANPHLNRRFNFHQGFDEYVDSDVLFPFMSARDEDQVALAEKPMHRARELFDAVVDFLPDDPDRPHYLQFNLMEVHQAFDPRIDFPDVRDRFPGNRYAQAVAHVSRAIDRFVERLASRPGWEDTLFVITSDHGETFTEHPSLSRPKFHGFLVYESQTRVPLILHGHGLHEADDTPEGIVVDRRVRLLDVMPTVLDLVDVEPPDGMVGESLVDLIEDPEAEVALDPVFVVETEFRFAEKIAAYGDDWKYIENRDGHPGTSPRELQRVGEAADGVVTDALRDRPGMTERLDAYLQAWEEAYPPASPTFSPDGPREREIEQLRSMGYID